MTPPDGILLTPEEAVAAGLPTATRLHHCCSPSCPGYPWPASAGRHPPGDLGAAPAHDDAAMLRLIAERLRGGPADDVVGAIEAGARAIERLTAARFVVETIDPAATPDPEALAELRRLTGAAP